MFVAAFALLFFGYPVAFTFGGVALLFVVINFFYENGWAGFEGLTFFESIGSIFELFEFMPYRVYSIMENVILMAIPLFIFMGIVLQKAKLAEKLLESMGLLFGNVRGGLAVSTVFVGALLAASTGVVGATVVSMGIISLPVMMRYGYNKELSTGVICASGTLGQIIPPSIVLILLGDVLNISVGDMFRVAVFPGLFLVSAYVIYILVLTNVDKSKAPPIVDEKGLPRSKVIKNALVAIIPPIGLIAVVLGSIFASIATPTESSAIGGVGAILLSIMYKQFSWKMLFESARETVLISSMVFAIFIGATAFSMVFSYTGADVLLEDFILSMPGAKLGFILMAMLLIFILGFFIDFIEICFIIVPILSPIAESLGIDLLWFGILIALNLQTSFLSPPFGFSLFYLKGIAPKSITTGNIYRGVIPFIVLQVLVLLFVLLFPEYAGFGAKETEEVAKVLIP